MDGVRVMGEARVDSERWCETAFGLHWHGYCDRGERQWCARSSSRARLAFEGVKQMLDEWCGSAGVEAQVEMYEYGPDRDVFVQGKRWGIDQEGNRVRSSTWWLTIKAPSDEPEDRVQVRAWGEGELQLDSEQVEEQGPGYVEADKLAAVVVGELRELMARHTGITVAGLLVHGYTLEQWEQVISCEQELWVARLERVGGCVWNALATTEVVSSSQAAVQKIWERLLDEGDGVEQGVAASAKGGEAVFEVRLYAWAEFANHDKGWVQEDSVAVWLKQDALGAWSWECAGS